MIVLDEQISRSPLRTALQHWYPGQVTFLQDLRPRTHILDDEIEKLLCLIKMPTFITTNYWDFWHKWRPHPKFCVICLKLPIERWLEVSTIVRPILAHPDFKTKKKRMGKIISWSDGVISSYDR